VGIPATGKRMTLEILEILQIEAGKIIGYWVFYDRLSLMHQLGVLPLPIR
jgi:predicted ester cyclase